MLRDIQKLCAGSAGKAAGVHQGCVLGTPQGGCEARWQWCGPEMMCVLLADQRRFSWKLFGSDPRGHLQGLWELNRELRNGPLENQRLRRGRFLESDLRLLLRGHPETSQKPGKRKNSFKNLPDKWSEFKAMLRVSDQSLYIDKKT